MITHIFWQPKGTERVSLCLTSSPGLSIPCGDSSELCPDCVAIREMGLKLQRTLKDLR